MGSIKSILSLNFARYIVKKNYRWKNNAIEYQNKTMHSLVNNAKNTLFGSDHFFRKISTYEDFKKNIPIRDYEGLKNYISLIKDGKKIFFGLENQYTFAKPPEQPLGLNIFH